MYYVLDNSHEPRRRIDDEPFIPGVSWWSGAVITQPIPTPLEFEMKRYIPESPDQSETMPAHFKSDPPLFRLAESTNTIMIHEKLKAYLEAQGFTQHDMHFWDPKDIAL